MELLIPKIDKITQALSNNLINNTGNSQQEE